MHHRLLVSENWNVKQEASSLHRLDTLLTLHDTRDTALLRVLRGGGSTSVADRHAIYTAHHHPDIHSLCVEAVDTDGATRSFCLEHVGTPGESGSVQQAAACGGMGR